MFATAVWGISLTVVRNSSSLLRLSELPDHPHDAVRLYYNTTTLVDVYTIIVLRHHCRDPPPPRLIYQDSCRLGVFVIFRKIAAASMSVVMRTLWEIEAFAQGHVGSAWACNVREEQL